ncbi:CHAT domain protein [Burkholderia pseudomallei MSHR1153]|uniref:hypothetical protein n=1 Tax=Burkholderia pseudomallei TaxID=28450 RepID=UPI00052ACD33|nr:hypothetical protein [Burkholderia pseudomallei]AIV53466.1 CHAT domain protein [Burkholderia pseudomallei MSHR1153]
MNEQDKGHVIHGFNPADLFGKGFDVGCADLIQGGPFREVVCRSVCALLLHAVDKNGRSAFTGATIVLPPATASQRTEESVFADLERAVNELRGFELDEREKPILHRLVRVVNSPSLEIADMLRTVQEQGERRLVVVADAGQYRDPSLELPATFGVTAVRVGEDWWVPHVASICRQIVPTMKGMTSYGLVHVPEVPAKKQANVDLLLSVDDCYVMTLRYEADPEDVFNSRAQAWRSMVLQGRLPEVVTELEGLALPVGAQLHALAQLLRGTGRDRETLDVIAQLQPHLSTLKAEAIIQVAQLAHQFGDDALADEILHKEPDGVSDQLWLEEGLELATHLEDNERIARFDALLAELFPNSERLRENRDRRLLLNSREPRSSQSHLFTTVGFTDQHLALQQWLSDPNPDYALAIEETRAWGQDWLELAVVCCGVHARSVGKPREAAHLASHFTLSKLYGRQATQVVLSSVKSMMLRELVPEEERDDYRQLFLAAFRFLAQHPEDSNVRSGLTTLLSVESCGDMGIPLMALTMLDLAEQGVQLARPSAKPGEEHSSIDEAVETSMRNGFVWLNEQGAGEPGVTLLPRELLVANPDDVVRSIARMVHLAGGQNGEDVDLQFMEKLVLLACATCPHATTERDDDIRLMRHLACQFATAGQFQRARNYAESILLMGQASAYRRRLAWQAFGDVYHRCRNHVVALVGLACALAVEVEVEAADLWHEVYAIHRVLRDLGLLELSRSFLPAMKTLLFELGFDADKDPRYVSADLGVRLMEIDGAALGPLSEFLVEVADACQSELGDRSRLAPLAMLLGQATLKAERAGVNISPEVREILNTALEQVGASMAEMVRTVSTPKPTATDVLAMLNEVEPAAYASDVAHDFAVLELAARRLLGRDSQDRPAPYESAFAVELLADHTVALVGDAPAMSVEWPTQYAVELNQVGLDIVFLVLDSQGELIVTYVSNGQVRNVEQPESEQTFRRRFGAWLQDYPRDYGRVNRSEGNNIFYLTMETLDVRLPQSERLILVAEPFLQQLTANLVVVQPEDGFGYFAGTRAAIGVVPSLGWFSTARAATRGSRTVYRAWISAEMGSAFEEGEAARDLGAGGAEQEELKREPTLDIALRRLSGCFEDFGFVVDTGRRLPNNMSDAGLAVVTAHGGLNREGRYLHSIRDDENLIEPPSALAAAFAGVELVILFVCSGGRIDKNPWDNSTTSLPKQLLDRGCRAVIASPWPLDVIVTYNWLEPFLREWEGGATALDATKTANDTVSRHLGEVPQYCLAMRVYGDVLLTKTPAESAPST